MENIRYALKNVKTGKWIALDGPSGGYPYDVDSVFQAKLWQHPTEPITYTAVMSWSDYNNPVFTLHAVAYRTEEQVMPTGADLAATRQKS